MAVAYGTVHDHDGFITIDSEIGEGTTFRILLPVVENRSIKDSYTSPTRPAQKPETTPAGSLTILLAEDEPLVREVGIRLLESNSYHVLSASDGQEAVELFKQHAEQIDGVMLDAKMPRLNGHEAYQRIRELDPNMKILFCTGYDPNPEQLDLDNPNTFLAKKPISPDALLNHIRSMYEETERKPSVNSIAFPVASLTPESTESAY